MPRIDWRSLVAQYGMLLVLFGLCAALSAATIGDRTPVGAEAGRQTVDLALTRFAAPDAPSGGVLVVAGGRPGDAAFVAAAADSLRAAGRTDVVVSQGTPQAVREVLAARQASQQPLRAIVATLEAAQWGVVAQAAQQFPALGSPELFVPRPYRWSSFLTAENLLNVANQNAVIAILAVGMTIVVLTGGIDLSVGSLIALSAVVCCLQIERWGGYEASRLALWTAGTLGVLLAGAVGLATGWCITLFRIPPFIATLASMLICSGLAYRLTGGESASRVPDAFTWLGQKSTCGLPHAVVLMLLLYGLAHLFLSRTALGRYVYAVGGNSEAARLSGVRVERVLWLAYGVSGLLAGLGGVVLASQLKSGSPQFGAQYELYVIAAVVVGGTSLSGGQGGVGGTLIGVLVIAVIRNGMNLLNVESNMQLVVLGGVILTAVVLDNFKQRLESR
jgi:ribose transport system permease protein